MPGSTNTFPPRQNAEVTAQGQGTGREPPVQGSATTGPNTRRQETSGHPAAVFNSRSGTTSTTDSGRRVGVSNVVDALLESRRVTAASFSASQEDREGVSPIATSSPRLAPLRVGGERGDGHVRDNLTTQMSNNAPPQTEILSSSSSSNNNNNNEDDGSTKDNNTSNNNNNNSSNKNNNVETLKPKSPPLVPSSPPTLRHVNQAAITASPIEPSKLSKIRQNHLASKKREQMRSRNSKLPELSEMHELDPSSAADSESASRPDDGSPTSLSGPRPLLPQISVTDDDDVIPPAPSDEPVTPSLPEAFLRKLGLAPRRKNSFTEDKSLDALSEKEIEGKFVSLSLAFKTDKLTIDQRVSVQERSRDLAEQNVDRELSGLRSAAEALTELLSDSQVTEVVQRIKQHIDVLEQSAARVSSRAEVYGAVQQERRMCKAMEVMVLHTENLKRIREREESELQEARKVLSERTGQGLGMDFDSSPSRRSMSVCAYNAGGRAMRRRSEVALPRVLGGSGSPSMSQLSNLDPFFPHMESPKSNLTKLSKSQEDDEEEDAKSRFQSVVASTSMQNAVTATMRRVSMERRRSVVSMADGGSPINSSPPLLKLPEEAAVTDSTKTTAEGATSVRKISTDEEAFRKGFEEGLKTQLSQEFNDLRDQQSSISQNLEMVMDKVEQANQEENGTLLGESTLAGKTTSMLIKLRETITKYDWRANKNVVKSLAGVFLVFLAIFVMLFSPPRAKVFSKTEK